MSFFNAHCHLELSHLRGKLRPGMPFVEWLERIVQLKRQTHPEQSRNAAGVALEEALAGGTRVLFDVLSLDTTATMLAEIQRALPGFQSLLFREIIGFQKSTSETLVEQLALRRGVFPEEGLSPHAPYTVHPDLMKSAVREAARRDEWLCIHAAETPEEVQMLKDGKGTLRDFLAPFLPRDWTPPGLSPIAYLDMLGALGPRTLLVHCNEMDDNDLGLIKARGCSVVVCPGTHVYFGRGAFPLPRLLEHGIPTYLGTDSLASNESLSMEREVRLAEELCNPRIDSCTIQALAHMDRASCFFKATL